MSEHALVDLGLLARVHEIYRRGLSESPEARQWLAGRGLNDVRLLERFELGFASGSMKHILPRDPAVLRALRALELLEGPGRGREALTGCVIVPLFDPQSRVSGLVGYPLTGGPLRYAGLPGGLFNWPAMKMHPGVRLYDDALETLRRILGGDEAVVALSADRWTALTEATFKELAPHAVLVDNAKKRPEIVERLKVLGIGEATWQDAAGGETTIEGGFGAVFGRRRYTVQAVSRENPRHLRGLVRAVGSTPGRFHLDAIDLYSSKDRANFVREAAMLFNEDPALIEADLTRLVLMAEEYLARRPGSSSVILGDDATREALELLRDPKLLDRILQDFNQLGVVGEEANKLVGYLVATSRKMDEPLSMLVVSRSAAGKSTLADAIAALVPPEDLLRLTRITGQALFYQKGQSLQGKLLVVEEAAGMAQAAYPLRVLQSAQRLAVATAQGTHEAEGPVAVIITTTRCDLGDETKGRFLIVSADESQKQTRAILEIQRQREAGERPPKADILKRHHTLQRCLRPLKIVNPYAKHLTFADHRLTTRREQPKYLALIRAVTFLRQYQRTERDGAIQVELEDIETAHRLADGVLGQNLEDLSPPARRLLESIHAWRPRGLFTRREAIQSLGWPMTQIWTYLKELCEQEWVIDRGSRPRRFDLAWDGREGKVCLGLRSIDQIRGLIERDSASFGKG